VVLAEPWAAKRTAASIHACWYAREVDLPVLDAGERWPVHFGAVEYEALV
jgi:hypothetical protein